MVCRLVIGAAGAGKTAYCLDQLVQLQQQDPGGSPVYYILPEQSTFIHERMLAARCGAFSRIRVCSFRRLAQEARRTYGGAPLKSLSDTGRSMVMNRVLNELRPRLQVYGAPTLQNGFAGELVSLMEELRNFGVTEEQLQDAATGALQQKLEDLLLIYQSYCAIIEDGYRDFVEELEYLAAAINEQGFLQGATVFIDGISDFNPRELVVLEALMRHTARLECTLLLSPEAVRRQPARQSVFYPSWQLLQKLTACAGRAGVEAERLLLPGHARFADAEDLLILTRLLEGAPLSYAEPTPHLHLTAAADKRQQVLFAAHKIRQLVREKGYRYRDISVIMRDSTPYAEDIAEVFTELEIPYFIDSRQSLLYHPLVEFCRAALELRERGCTQTAIFRYLKSGLAPLASDEVDLLENYCLAAGIRPREWFAAEPWQLRRRQRVLRGLDEDEVQAYIEHIDALRRRAVLGLEAFLSVPQPCAMRELTAALRALLDAVGAADTLDSWQQQAIERSDAEAAAVHRQAAAAVDELLAEAEQLLGEVPLDAAQSQRILEAGFEALSLALIPPGLDQVLIANLQRSRQGGLNADELPQKTDAGAVLSDRERAELEQRGVQLAPDTLQRQLAENQLAYVALTRCGGELYLAYALTDGAGKELAVSPLISRIRRAFPQLQLHYYRQDGEVAALGGGTSTLAQLARQLARQRRGLPVDEYWHDVYAWYRSQPQYAQQLQMLLSGYYYRPSAEVLSPNLRQQLYGRELRGSVSRLEAFAVCPRAYFAGYGLKLDEREERGIAYADIDAAAAEALVDEALELIVPQFLGGILLGGGRYDYLLARNRRALIGVVADTAQLLAADGYVPVAWEQGFGMGEGSFAALTLELPGERRLVLRGVIDRIDVKETEEGSFFRVIDYKTGMVKISTRDVYSGRRLQLLSYLQVVAENARFAHAYGKAHYQLLSDDLKKVDSGAAAAPPLKLTGLKDDLYARVALPQVLAETATRLLDGEIAAQPLLDGEDHCARCDYRDFCGFDRELCSPRRPRRPEDDWDTDEGTEVDE